jgi:methylmalonyl-CoA mutase cobalamin-binding domain/chain
MDGKAAIRVLVAKPGLDGHDRGAKVVATALRDAGMEVIYGGLHMSAEEIVSLALQEDVDVIGISVLSGAHKAICRKVMGLLERAGASDLRVVVGGIVPPGDVAALEELGVAAVFVPGTALGEITRVIRNLGAASERAVGRGARG